jgi:hypothetical protein
MPAQQPQIHHGLITDSQHINMLALTLVKHSSLTSGGIIRMMLLALLAVAVLWRYQTYATAA